MQGWLLTWGRPYFVSVTLDIKVVMLYNEAKQQPKQIVTKV